MHGRKRQLLTDTLGLLWAADVHSAQVHDSRGALDVVKEAVAKLGRVFKMYVDSGYRGDVSAWLEARHIEVVIPAHLTPEFYAPGSALGRRAFHRVAHTPTPPRQGF